MRRREFVAGLGSLAVLADCSTSPHTAGPVTARSQLRLPSVDLSVDRIMRLTVCTRPFRAQGPRLDVEQIGAKTVVHNYGHGGSGWSLSWGSSSIAAGNALATGQRQIAVIGCGALGLTSALTLLRAGAKVTIYAKERPPQTRSTFATGEWTPDSRICLEANATTAFKQLWQRMARTSHQAYTNLLGLAGTPIEFIDSYALTDIPFEQWRAARGGQNTIRFANLQRELTPELMTTPVDLAPGSHPFPVRYARRTSNLMFNLSAYQRLLVDDFLTNGGRIVSTEFHTPDEFSRLEERVIVNATGYGARALLGDQSVIPVRGQLARLIPQAGVHYGFYYDNVSFVPRRDGFVVQDTGADEAKGFNDASTEPDPAESERAVRAIAKAAPQARGPSGSRPI